MVPFWCQTVVTGVVHLTLYLGALLSLSKTFTSVQHWFPCSSLTSFQSSESRCSFNLHLSHFFWSGQNLFAKSICRLLSFVSDSFAKNKHREWQRVEKGGDSIINKYILTCRDCTIESMFFCFALFFVLVSWLRFKDRSSKAQKLLILQHRH